MASPKIFVSMGTPYTTDMEHFRDSLESFLRDQCNVDPRIIGKNEYPSGSPLTKIKEVMRTCSGVIVVAYERKFIAAGTEKRLGLQPNPLIDMAYTTPWNHIESAMAFSLDIPLYILCQHGLVEEGLVESKIDWYVQYVDILPSTFQRRDVTQSIKAWVDTKVASNDRRPRLLRTIEGGIRLSELTPKEIAGALGVLSATFALGVSAAKFLPL